MACRNVWWICLCVLLIFSFSTLGPRFSGDGHQHRIAIKPLRQDQAYHHFADQRAFIGLGNAGDTLSNLAFIAVGVLGLLFMWRERRGSTHFEAPEEMRAYWILFGALTLTGLGSAYYHQAPDDARLVWDRLPMAIAFMSLLAAVITERVKRKTGVQLIAPFIALGIGSVAYWAIFDDLWPYFIVQFGSMAALLVLGALFPSRYTKGGMLFLVLGVYAVAKLLETYDRDIYELGHWVSGHSLKHVAAAYGGYLIMHSLMRRSVRPSGDHLLGNDRRTKRSRRCNAAPGFLRRYWVGVVLVAGGSAVLASLWDVASAATPDETELTHVADRYAVSVRLEGLWHYRPNQAEQGFQLRQVLGAGTPGVRSLVISVSEKEAFTIWPKVHSVKWAAENYRRWEEDVMLSQATLDIAEKRPIQIGFENRQAAQVVNLN